MRSEIKIKCLGLPSSIYLIKSSICLWYFPKIEEKVLCLSWCCSASPLVTGVYDISPNRRKGTLSILVLERITSGDWCRAERRPHRSVWVGLPNQADHTTSHHINKLVSPTKRTTTPHTTPPQHQDGAWHCLSPDHLDRLGSFLGHRSECCEWLKLLKPSLCGGHPLIKVQSKYSTLQFLCFEVEGTKK